FSFPPCRSRSPFYTLSLHDALPISLFGPQHGLAQSGSRTLHYCRLSATSHTPCTLSPRSTIVPNRKATIFSAELMTIYHSTSEPDRKSTRLNSSHDQISYAVFCLKK